MPVVLRCRNAVLGFYGTGRRDNGRRCGDGRVGNVLEDVNREGIEELVSEYERSSRIL